MLNFNHIRNRGDTLIEVLLAITVFSLVAVGAMAIMNSGTATSQRALEISLVRNEIDAQAETLRFLNASYIANYPSANYSGPAAQWKAISNSLPSVPIQSMNASCPTTKPNNSFIVDPRFATFYNDKFNGQPQTYSQVRYPDDTSPISAADSIWIEGVKSGAGGTGETNIGYIDFYIRACWPSPGQTVPVILQTIVRLYEPR